MALGYDQNVVLIWDVPLNQLVLTPDSDLRSVVTRETGNGIKRLALLPKPL